MAVLAAHQFGLSRSSTQLSGNQLCRALLSTGAQVLAELRFRHLGKAKGHTRVCSEANGAEQGVVLCKMAALMSPFPERRGCSRGIWWGSCACRIPPLLSGMLLQRCMAGIMHRRHALLSLSSCCRRVAGEAGEWEEGAGWAGVRMGPRSSGMCWSEATGLPLGATGAGESGDAMGPWGCQGGGGAGGSGGKGE